MSRHYEGGGEGGVRTGRQEDTANVNNDVVGLKKQERRGEQNRMLGWEAETRSSRTVAAERVVKTP